MSMGLLVGFIIAYPMNWWLVANHLKHGMMTVRPTAAAGTNGATPGAMDGGMEGSMEGNMKGSMEGMAHSGVAMAAGAPPSPSIPVMTVLSFVALAAGLALPSLLMR
jgi:hypothetical protein